MNVLIVGQGDSIFFESYTKSMKQLRPDINIDVFSVDTIKGQYDLSACRSVTESSWNKSYFRKIKGLRTIIMPFYIWIKLYCYLEKSKIKYDIVHFKWLISGVVLFPKVLQKFYKKKVATFWGAEIETQKIFLSNILYLKFLNRFLLNSNAIVVQLTSKNLFLSKRIKNKNKIFQATYPSSIADTLYKTIELFSKKQSKEILGVDTDKITISIGHSGKALHEHIKILSVMLGDELFQEKKDLFTIILPMNYGCGEEYSNTVENFVKQNDLNYIIFKNKLNPDELAHLRNATDIIIRHSIAGGRPASIIELFIAGTIVIASSWLPNESFHDHGLYFYEIDAIDQKLPELILRIANNIENELSLCNENKNKWPFETWEKVIPNWINIYEKVLQEA